ncbi:hypothetical protein ACIRSU_12810 [Streptomyces sp. NPDC101160]|uniref:hypothetical protein n=1 Tax=Streptomyces sp. NPDC101160 TaxID=3366118 RepID=UPI0038106D69
MPSTTHLTRRWWAVLTEPHGGMSGGMVHLDTWRHRLLPLLVERAGRPRDPRTLLAR